jgi:hypothetical protein
MKPDFSSKSNFGTGPKTTLKINNLRTVAPKKETTEDGEKIILNEAFTAEDVNQAWQSYAESRKKFQAEYQLLQQGYDLHDNVLTVKLYSPIQEDLFNEIRLEVSTFVREKIRNTNLQVRGELVEIEDSQRVYYTAKDKFDHLIQNNPTLREFKDRFGLDTDY